MTTGNITIRRAELHDCKLLAQLNLRLIRDEGHRNKSTLAELEDRLRGWIGGNEENYHAHIFELDGETVGYVLTRDEQEHTYIRHFLIVEKNRRQGLGRLAFEQMSDKVWKGVARLRLDVLIENQRAIDFWHSMGFRNYCITMEREQKPTEAN